MRQTAIALDWLQVERAVVVEASVPVEADGDVGGWPGLSTRLLIGPVIGLAHVGIEVDRIERHNGGEQRRGSRATAAAAQLGQPSSRASAVIVNARRGGASTRAMCYVRGQIRDFTAWQDAVGDTGEWSYEDPHPVFVAQEDNDTFRDEFHGINGGLAVQLLEGLGRLPERTVTTSPSISRLAKPACRTRQRPPRNSSKRRAPMCAAA